MAQATVLGVDTVTRGEWIGRLGAAGWWISEDTGVTARVPPWLTVINNPPIDRWFTFSDPTNLRRPGGVGVITSTSRPQSAVTDYMAFDIAAARPCVVSAYFSSLDDLDRRAHINWLDGGATLDETLVLNTRGVWVRSVVVGAVRLKIGRPGASNYYLGGLFFDPYSPNLVGGLLQGFVGHGVF